MKLKIAGNALNRPQNHKGDKETHKRNKVGIFYLNLVRIFELRFFPIEKVRVRFNNTMK